MTGVTVRVPAKLNLQLAVGPPRADGYHDLVTVFHAVSLFDEITAEPAGRDKVTVSGEGADRVPADGDNLALRAAAALRAAVPSAPCVHITIAKRIPVAAGLAGGSGDAAAALDRQRARAAEPVPAEPALDAALMSALRSGDARLVGRTLSNDLQPAALSLFPALRKTLAAGLELGALGALVSGSGPTCVFLAASADRALDLAASLSGAGVCRSVARASGPVPGATIISGAR